jgi:hypothetical protein
MPETKHITRLMPYASSGDFHRIFKEPSSRWRLQQFLDSNRSSALFT